LINRIPPRHILAQFIAGKGAGLDGADLALRTGLASLDIVPNSLRWLLRFGALRFLASEFHLLLEDRYKSWDWIAFILYDRFCDQELWQRSGEYAGIQAWRFDVMVFSAGFF